MSKFGPLALVSGSFRNMVESWRPAGFQGVSPTNLGFAMWTPTTRQQHSRPVTRYQTDLTDAEWRVIAPHLPKPAQRAGRGPGRCARSSTASSMSCGRAARGGCCRTTCRHGGRFTAGSPPGRHKRRKDVGRAGRFHLRSIAYAPTQHSLLRGRVVSQNTRSIVNSLLLVLTRETMASMARHTSLILRRARTQSKRT